LGAPVKALLQIWNPGAAQREQSHAEQQQLLAAVLLALIMP